MTVFIVFKEGPEWNVPVKCFECKKAAEACAKHHNNKTGGDVYDLLSTYVVRPMDVVKRKP